MKIPASMNLLDGILLSESAVLLWYQAARQAVANSKIKPDEVAEEDAEVLPDGCLRIFCNDIDDNLIAEKIISHDQWAWSTPSIN